MDFLEKQYHGQKKSYKDSSNIDLTEHREHLSMNSNFLDNIPLELFKRKKTLVHADGRVECDAGKLINHSCEAISSDISFCNLPKQRKKFKKLNNFVSNLENLPLKNKSVDNILIIDGLHHLPRPYMAIYECMRVAKTALILNEPDLRYQECFYLKIKKLIYLIWRGCWPKHWDYEPAGNYIYSINLQEMLRLAHSLNLPFVGVKYLDYIVTRNQNTIYRSAIQVLHFILRFFRIRKHKNIIIYFSLSEDNDYEKRLLIKNRFKIIDLNKNPYI